MLCCGVVAPLGVNVPLLISTVWKPDQIANATGLIDGRGIVRIGLLYLAVSSKGDARYQCSPTGECTCLAAANGVRCYHTLAASILAAA